MLQTVVPSPSPSERFSVPPPGPVLRDEVSVGAVELIPVLRAFALSLTRNWARADDLVQDALVKMLAHSHQFQTGSNLKAWAFTILRHCHINTAKRAVNQATDELEAAHCQIEGAQEWRLQNLSLQSALDELPAEQRDVVIMVGALGFTYEEAAEAMGCAVGTIKSRLFRARATLAQRLGHEEGEWRLAGR